LQGVLKTKTFNKQTVKAELTDILETIKSTRAQFSADLKSRITVGVQGPAFMYGKINKMYLTKLNKVNNSTINRYTKIINSSGGNASVFPPIMQMDQFLLNYNRKAVNTISSTNTTNLNSGLKAAANAVKGPGFFKRKNNNQQNPVPNAANNSQSPPLINVLVPTQKNNASLFTPNNKQKKN
jgi:hypothetical protein